MKSREAKKGKDDIEADVEVLPQQVNDEEEVDKGVPPYQSVAPIPILVQTPAGPILVTASKTIYRMGTNIVLRTK